MRFALISSLALAISTAACGGGICERAQTVSKDLAAKVSACSTISASFTATFNRANCDANVKSCTSSDTTTINASYDCLEKVPACVAGKEADFGTAAGACFSTIGSLSAACQTALTAGR